MNPSTAAYQRHRSTTLRAMERQRILATGLALAKQNQRKGKHYSRRTLKVLRGGQ